MTEILVLSLQKNEFHDKSLTVPSIFWAVSAIAINFTTDMCSVAVFFTVGRFVGCKNIFSKFRFMASVRFTFNSYFKFIKNSGLSVLSLLRSCFDENCLVVVLFYILCGVSEGCFHHGS